MRVCILVMTTYTYDSRVRRTAEALAADGYDVNMICCFSRQLPAKSDERLGLVQVHRVARETRDFIALALLRSRPHRDAASASPGVRTRRRWVISARAGRIIRRPVSVSILILHRLHQQRRMARALAQLGPDIVHANDPNTLPAAASALDAGARLVYDSHELASNRSDTAWWQRWLDLRAERRYIPRADAVITVSPGIAEILQDRHRVPITVIRNVPHPPADWTPPFNLRERLGIGSDERLILHLGGRTPGRGLAQLVRAMALVPDAQLVMLGSEVRDTDQMLRTIAAEMGVSERVHLLDPVPVDVLLAMAAQADVGVTLLQDISLNHHLALPNKLFEYLTAGVPVVASDLPEIRRVLEECNGGIVCDPSDPSAIAAALRSVVDPPDHARIPKAEEELQKLKDCYRRLRDLGAERGKGN